MTPTPSPESNGHSQLPNERRVSPRHACRLEVYYETSTPSAGRPAVLRDISAGGIGLVVGDAIPRGALVTVQLSRDGEEVLFRKSLRIKYARNEAPGSWAIGGSFDKQLTKKEMKQLLNETAGDAGAE